MGGIVFICFALLVFLGLPIGVAIGVPTLIPTLLDPKFAGSTSAVIRYLASALDNITTLALPLFMLSGAIMARGGLSKKLFDVFAYIVGKRTAGLPCAVIVTFSELYLALQQGLVDAQENPLDVILTNKLYEQQKYIVNTNHEPFYYGLAMNNVTWNSLPEEYQNAILDVVENIREVAYEKGIESEQAALDQMVASGVTYVEFSDDDYAKMKEACKTSVYDVFRNYCGDELVDLAIKTAEDLEAK